MINIKEQSVSNSESDILSIIDYINEILNYAECNPNCDYIITYDDMSSLNEAIKKLRRVAGAKNAFGKRRIWTVEKDDPDTDVTLYALRTIVKSGLVPTVRLGRKVLINYDSLLEYFRFGDKKQTATDAIRQINR